ncbi:MAG: DUF4358 domain-containing protein [Lachnospiraceae bacterium]|mgnify:CR=1 FL=1|jgi:hypothetical protein
MNTIKSTKAVAALAAIMLVCTGCSSDKAVPTANTTDQTAVSDTADNTDTKTTKSIDEIYREIGQTVTLQSPQCMDDDFISNYYGIDASMLEEYVFSMSEDAAQAETIIIMKLKNTDDLASLQDSLQTVVDEKKNEMENYIPEQFAIVEKSKVQTKENYIWLVISENADAITDIIESGLF